MRPLPFIPANAWARAACGLVLSSPFLSAIQPPLSASHEHLPLEIGDPLSPLSGTVAKSAGSDTEPHRSAAGPDSTEMNVPTSYGRAPRFCPSPPLVTSHLPVAAYSAETSLDTRCLTGDSAICAAICAESVRPDAAVLPTAVSAGMCIDTKDTSA